MGEQKGRHYYVIVSNNERNKRIDSVLGVVVTSTDKSGIPSAVRLSDGDPVDGLIVADIVEELWDYEVAGHPVGFLTRKTMDSLNAALRIALGLQ